MAGTKKYYPSLDMGGDKSEIILPTGGPVSPLTGVDDDRVPLFNDPTFDGIKREVSSLTGQPKCPFSPPKS